MSSPASEIQAKTNYSPLDVSGVMNQIRAVNGWIGGRIKDMWKVDVNNPSRAKHLLWPLKVGATVIGATVSVVASSVMMAVGAFTAGVVGGLREMGQAFSKEKTVIGDDGKPVKVAKTARERLTGFFKGLVKVVVGLAVTGTIAIAIASGVGAPVVGAIAAGTSAVSTVPVVGHVAAVGLTAVGNAAAAIGSVVSVAPSLVSAGLGIANSATVTTTVTGLAASSVVGIATTSAVGAAVVIGGAVISRAVENKAVHKNIIKQMEKRLNDVAIEPVNQSNTNNSKVADQMKSLEINSIKLRQQVETDLQPLTNVATNSGSAPRTLESSSAVRIAPDDVVKMNALLKSGQAGCHLKYDGNERGVMRITGRDPVSALQSITQAMPDVAKQIKGTGFILKMPTGAPDTQIKIFLDKVENGIPKITGVINGKGETIPVIMDKGKAILNSTTVIPQEPTNDRSRRLT